MEQRRLALLPTVDQLQSRVCGDGDSCSCCLYRNRRDDDMVIIVDDEWKMLWICVPISGLAFVTFHVFHEPFASGQNATRFKTHFVG